MTATAPPTSADPLIPMIGYWRVSMTTREEPLSPKMQISKGERWARHNGRRIVRWVGDLDKSGRNFNRKVQEVLSAIEAGEADEIGVYRYTRWGRNTREALNCLKRVEDAGAQLVSWNEPFDARTAFGKFSRGQAFLMAELESDMIGDAWRDTHANRRSRGLPATGRARFGYQRLGRVPNPDRKGAWQRDPDDPAGERYIPDPILGPVLAALYHRATAGESSYNLVRWLNNQGITTVRGYPFDRHSLMDILQSGFGAGLLRTHDPDCRCKKGIGRCQRITYLPGVHPPVIGPGEWEDFLTSRQAHNSLPPRLRNPVHPLSGLMFCGSCGYRMTIAAATGGRAFRCGRHRLAGGCPTGAYIPAADAETAVLAELTHWAGDAEQHAIDAARDRVVVRARSRHLSLASRETKLLRKLARLAARQADDDIAIPGDAYKLARDQAVAELDAVRAALKEASQAQKDNAGEYRPVVVSLLDEWDTFSPARQRQMLGTVIRQVEVHRTGYRQPPRVAVIPVWADTPPASRKRSSASRNAASSAPRSTA